MAQTLTPVLLRELIDKIEVRKQVIDEDGCVEVVNERLIKIIDA